MVNINNIFIFKSLNTLVARCISKHTNSKEFNDSDDEQLQHEVLLCPGERVMLTCNLWVEAGLVNGAIGTAQNTFYCDGSKPPQLRIYTIVCFDNYIGVLWDTREPKFIPITPISRGNHKQITLRMAWALTIHK